VTNNPHTNQNQTDRPNGTHIVALLDRSGSMSSIVNDVIGGFNTFLADQQANGADARISIILFDSQDPQEVVVWGAPVTEAIALDRTSYVPRGGTPLLDATGLAIGRVMVDQGAREATGMRKDDIVFVTVTDGEENQSHEYTLEKVRQLVADRTADGWQFVFLSAGLDAYADAARFGYDQGSTSAWNATGRGSRAAMMSMSRATSNFRDKKRSGRDADAKDFFETGKDAEEQG
jgi:Mg-chelatase subunit ChlD